MNSEKSGRNKTIDISVEEGREYIERCICVASPVAECADILDKTIVGDTLSVMPLLPSEFADLIIADPPYNLRKNYNGSIYTRKSDREYEDYTRKWLSLAVDRLRPGGSMYVCCDWQSSMIIGEVLSEFLCIRNRITWQREKGRGALNNWKNGMEDIWYATKGNDFYFDVNAVKQRRRVIAPYRSEGKPKDWIESEQGNFRDTCPSNFWDDISIPFWSMSENTAHPTQKPEKLAAKLILASSRPGDTVFDPFLGSGTTSVTAKKLGRHYVGIEREERYCAWAELRLERAGTDKEIQGYTDGIFFERNYKAIPHNAARADAERK